MELADILRSINTGLNVLMVFILVLIYYAILNYLGKAKEIIQQEFERQRTLNDLPQDMRPQVTEEEPTGSDS